MGYTHYLYRAEELPTDKYQAFQEHCKELFAHCKKNDIGLVNGNGNPETEPIIEEGSVAFNGIADESHETAYLERVFGDGYCQPNDDGLLFTCCKTAYKQYDIAVVAFYHLAVLHFGDLVSFSSDGEEKDLADGKALAEKIFN